MLKSVLLGLSVLIVMTSIAEAQDKPDPTKLWDQAWNGQFKAAVHVRYHNHFAEHYGYWDRVGRWLALAAGVLSLALPYAIHAIAPPRTLFGKTINFRRWFVRAAYSATFFGLMCALYLTVYPYNDWRTQHTVAYQRWNALKNDWGKLKREYPTLKYEEIDRRVTELQREEVAVEDIEPLINDETKMREFQEQERKFEKRPKPEIAAFEEPLRR